MASRRQVPTPKRSGWEGRLLAVLVHPMNIAAAGLAAAVLSLGIVTALPAALVAARMMQRWLDGDDQPVFTGVFREFAGTWRRSLPLGVASAIVSVVVVVDGAFLLEQAGRGSTLAIVLLAATVPVALAIGLILVTLPVAAARDRDARARTWLLGAGARVAAHPLRAALLLLAVVTFGLCCYLVPTLLPFFGASLPAYLAVRSWHDR